MIELRRMYNFLFVFYCCCLISLTSWPVDGQNRTTLRHVHVIARSGFSKPLTTMINDTNNAQWSDVPNGYLTNLGKRNTFESGRELRREYVDLLSARANSDETYMRSTDTNRALMSAEQIMAGLYPPRDPSEIWTLDKSDSIGTHWQPTPVHTLPKGGDPFTEDYAMKFCPKFMQFFKIFLKTPEAKRIYQRVEAIQAVVEAKGAYKWNDVHGFLNFGTIIERQVKSGFKFEDWLAPYVPEILDLYRYFTLSTVNVPELRKLAGGPLIYEIMNRISTIAKRGGRTDKKMFFYMAHTESLMYILSLFYQFNGIIPPFDARLQLELHQDVNVPNKFYMRGLYKNETDGPAYPLRLPGCPRSSANNLCPWKVVWEKTKRNFVSNVRQSCRPVVFLDLWNTQLRFNIKYP